MFPGVSYQEVLGGLEWAGGYGEALPDVTFTGNFFVGDRTFRADEVLDEAVVPEPATLALVGAGLAVVGGVARRRRRT